MTELGVVSISGGKDSTATALLAIDELGPENVRLVMADTGNEEEVTMTYSLEYLPRALGLPVEVVRADFSRQIAGKRTYVEHVWPTKGVPDEIIRNALSVLHPTGVPFLDLCIWKGRFPSRKAQFCTQHLKRIPLDAYLLERMGEGSEVSSWRGIRRDESRNRRDAKEIELTAEGYTIRHPIASWSAMQVVDFVRSRGVELNPLYSQGMHRVGCMPCINCGKDELLEIARRYPQHIDKISEWERIVCLAAKRGWTTFFTDAKEDEDESDASVFSRLKIEERIRWARTSRGGRQFDLVRDEEPQQCASVYGLCE
jgi:3'-phosphoadenosine 5'-phosphosulfate sulfotransferase (PAPS reductase)/FAD synthetase